MLMLEECRKDLLFYTECCDPNYVSSKSGLHAFISRLMQDVAEGKKRRVILSLPPQHGKQLADSTPVLTTEGWKTHGELKAGDYVFAPSGKPVMVVAESGRSSLKMNVTFNTGETIKAHPNHEWLVKDRRNHTRGFHIFETKQMAGDVWVNKSGARGSRRRFHLPDIEALEFERKELVLPPYVLGAWLGDGSKGKACVTKAPEDVAVLDKIRDLGYPFSAKWVHKQSGCVTASYGCGKLKADLRMAGVLNRKHIPAIYLQSSIEQRMDLLAGLMDTDGNVEPKTGRCRIVTTVHELRDGIYELCAGLGFRPSITSIPPRTTSIGIVGRETCYTIAFQPTMTAPTVLERRTCRVFSQRRRAAITDITPCEPESGKCIQVESDDGMYLVGRTLIPTHNSRCASIELPTYMLGQNPKAKIVLSSYSKNRAEKNSRDARARMDDPLYHALFPFTKLSSERAAAEEWETTEGGGVKAVGVGSALTGFSADLIVVDDYLKDFSEAHSPTIRETVWNWFLSVAYTRLSKTGAIVIIATRWHADDLIGRLIDPVRQKHLRDDGFPDEEWEVVNLPALAEENDLIGRKMGEALFPERYDEANLRAKKAVMAHYIWTALYRGDPVIKGGNYIKVENFQVIDRSPDELFWVRAWDLAASEDTKNDYTAGIAGALGPHPDDPEGKKDKVLYLRGMVRGQWEWPIARDRMLLTTKAEKIVVGVEANGLAIGLYQNLMEDMPPTVRCERHQAEKDKLTRALEWIALVDRKMVFLVFGDWIVDFIAECAAFNAGKHDDQVDAVSLVHLMLTKTRPISFDASRSVPERLRNALASRRSRKMEG